MQNLYNEHYEVGYLVRRGMAELIIIYVQNFIIHFK